MIFFRVEISSDSSILVDTENISAMNQWKRTEYLSPYNTRFIDFYEENASSVLIQIATFDSANNFLAYVMYPPESLKKGKIYVEQDVYRACKLAEFPSKIKSISSQEISTSDYNRAVQRYEMNSSRLRDISAKKFAADFNRYDTYGYQLSDRIVENDIITDKIKAKKAARKLLPDAALVKEIDRIFDSKHPKDAFYGIPVHYKMSVKSDLVADEMVDLIAACLFCNKRILSRRVTKIDKIEDRRWDKENFAKIMKCSQDSIIEIMLNGDVATEQEYASQFHQVSDMLAEYIKNNSGTVLFFFIENTSHPGFAKQLLGKIDEDLDILEINEGVGNAAQATQYFLDLLKDSNMQNFYEGDVIFQKRKFYSATEVRSRFNQWRKERLKDRVYKAYNQNQTLKIDKETKEKGSAFEELQSMIGLAEVKDIVKDIIAAYKVQKMRNKYYDSNDSTTKHMIFTGNPGTAKTTVARLLTEIMKENGILKTGTFIECGRADLVGKYVGWTAQIVKEKFNQAQGGILFIDEAYSLVEDRAGLYGDEAINTIVQEMENKRGDVIVIFAGYPEKMKDFLAKNEGLRSRIAFHVNFPDYSPKELMGILEKILRDKQFVMTSEAKDKAKKIFEQVYTQDEYGNGRFVRNLFEQAVNRQASRIAEMSGKEIDREKLFEILPSDLDVNIINQYEKKQGNRIGFL